MLLCEIAKIARSSYYKWLHRTQSKNEKWLTDVTEMKYGTSSKAYLSVILDLYDGSMLGTSNNNSLVFKTLDLTLKVNSGSTPLLHSDRGVQYTSPT
ncbi:DDE-type integrase/transposase/recombinase [Bacillus toyonensis]|uniref:DDE-type integrase/transposase/recombinase n=1 Tax=Bacillus toyonensis TaxID=155322 RepID=UPI000BF6116D|nr:DDE-type integrase/transposase/recombinase [Bacillus toyonensis]